MDDARKARVEHFEIPAGDLDRARAFYADVLGFSYEPWDDAQGMLRQADGEGIDGDLHIRQTLPHPTVVFTVDSIEATIARAIEAGGEPIGEVQMLDETSRWTYLRDSEGNVIGLFDRIDESTVGGQDASAS